MWLHEAVSRKDERGVEFRVVHQSLPKYRLHASVEFAIGGAMFSGAIPEAFQPPNGKSTAALAVEQLTLRIPGARAGEIFDPLQRVGKNGGSQTLLHTLQSEML